MNRSSYVAVRLVGVSLCLLSVSCGGRRSDAQALYEANAAALEQSVDMSGGEADTDRYLKFDATTVALGDVPMGQTREVAVRARNISDDVLVIVNAVTSCSCTKIGTIVKRLKLYNRLIVNVIENSYLCIGKNNTSNRPRKAEFGGIAKINLHGKGTKFLRNITGSSVHRV